MTPDYFIDPDNGIIAAGPVVTVDCGALGAKYVRAVLRDVGGDCPYRTNIEEVGSLGEHVGYDPAAQRYASVYRIAMDYFLELMADVNRLGRGYHDYD